MEVIALAIVFLYWFACCVLGRWVSVHKGRSGGEGFVLGMLFGPLGVLVAALMPTVYAVQPPPPIPAVLPSPKTMAWVPKPKPEPAVEPEPPPRPSRKRPFVVGDDGVVRWTCECGHYRTAPAALSGTREVCPRCRMRAVVPGAAS